MLWFCNEETNDIIITRDGLYNEEREYQLVRPSNFNLQLIKGQTLSLSTFLSYYSDKLIVSTPTISQLAYLVVPPRKYC